MGTGVLTGLNSYQRTGWNSGKNLSITGGADLGVYAIGRYEFAIEVRGRYPMIGGKIDAEKNLLGGLRIARQPGETGRLRPYADALFGRGQMDYQSKGYVVGNLLYTRSAGAVFGAGAGIEYDLTQRFSAKADVQLERWTPPVIPGALHSTVMNVGLTYRIGAGDGPR